MIEDAELRAVLKRLAERIAAFDAACEEAQYTDTGEAWLLLNDIRAVLEAAQG